MLARNLRAHARALPRLARRTISSAPSETSSGATQNASTSSSPASSTTHFGYRDVPVAEKESLVKDVFSSVASSYDLMNDAMSLGVHRLWKDSFIEQLNPGAPRRRGSEPMKCIDVAGGTGDIALRILDHAREKHAEREISVQVVDINPDMLKEGKKRVRRTMYHNTPQIGFKVANAQALPPDVFPESTFDLYTIAFGIRNCTSIPDVLREAYRVLKPGGTFACLEFSKVNNPVFASFYESYSFSVIPLLGTILAGDRDSYQYLVESIRRFPSQPDFAGMIQDAGFATGQLHEGSGGAWRDLWGGIACVHTGVKL